VAKTVIADVSSKIFPKKNNPKNNKKIQQKMLGQQCKKCEYFGNDFKLH
jgi:hypothetical protein